MPPYIIAEKSERFVSEFWGQTFDLWDARRHALRFAEREKRAVYLWDLDQSPLPSAKPFQIINPPEKPLQTIAPGMRFQLMVNQGWREAVLLASLADDALVEYTMPNETTALRIVPLKVFTGERRQKIEVSGQSISYRTIPLKWLKVLVEGGMEWYGNPQTQRGRAVEILSVHDLWQQRQRRSSPSE